MSSSGESFGRLRSFLWPIYRHELKRFLPMLLIFFLICFNYNLLRTAKDALVVTAPSSGAEAIPFLKVWAILPMAFLFTFIFTRLSNHLKRENVLYAVMSGFLIFFLIFGFLLYPYREVLHPNHFADQMQELLPIGFKGFIALFRNWTYTAFYVMSEMWSPIVMTVLFWGFANDVTSVQDAKRYYGILGIGANLSSILSGQAAIWVSSHTFNPKLPFGNDAWGQSVIFLIGLIVLSGLICMLLFRWLHTQKLGYNSHFAEHEQGNTPIKMGLRKNFAHLAKSKYLIYLAVIVVCYNIAINLVEVVWKDQLKQLFPNPTHYNAYMGKVLTSIGVLSTFVSIFITGYVIRKTSWSFSAMITPFILFITGIGFFAFLFCKDLPSIAAMAIVCGTTPLGMCAFFGALQNCFSRASKYTLFDATKELAFIPLSNESKLKGKAAIDGVGSRIGKSGGSLIHQGLLMLFGTVSLSTPYVAVILLIVFISWMYAVRALGRRFNDLTAHQEEQKVGSVREKEEPSEVKST